MDKESQSIFRDSPLKIRGTFRKSEKIPSSPGASFPRPCGKLKGAKTGDQGHFAVFLSHVCRNGRNEAQRRADRPRIFVLAGIKATGLAAFHQGELVWGRLFPAIAQVSPDCFPQPDRSWTRRSGRNCGGVVEKRWGGFRGALGKLPES